MTEIESESLRSEIAALISSSGEFQSDECLSWIAETPDSGLSQQNAFSRLLENFVKLDLSEEEAVYHWRKILENFRTFELQTGRKINIYTAIVDYFTSKNSLLDSPLLVEISVFRKNEQMAMIDALTGIFNRRYMETMLKKEFTRCERYGKEFSVCIIDIDNFKAINDTRGHLFGDLVLKELASLLKSSIREEDIACRYGGEEFLIIIPETNSEGALILGNRIRQCLKETPFFTENGISFSGGTANYPENARDTMALVRAADMALYQAKDSGKDQIVAASPERRKFDRFEQIWTFDVFDGDRDIRSENKTQNVSLGGIQFESTEKFPLHGNLNMVFTTDDARTEGITAKGHVTWIRKSRGKYRYGVRFDDAPLVFETKFLQACSTVQQMI